MKHATIAEAVRASADPARAGHFFELLASKHAPLETFTPDQARVVAAVLAGSIDLGNLLVARPEWLAELDPARLRYPRRGQGLRSETNAWLPALLDAGDYATVLARVREFKQREMLRIAARDLARFSNLTEITREISDLADLCLSAVLQVCRRQLSARYGRPWHQDAAGEWRPTEFCVLGMGKLGGQELNYSSDVDVLFLYADEGGAFKEEPGKSSRPILANHQYFKRLAEAFIAEISRSAPEGMLFRIDLRLRPEGDAGPLCRSLDSYENYYAQWGQTWERMMLIKTRCVAGDESLAAEFLEMIQPFRYPRAISHEVIGEIAAMKDRMEHEVLKQDELDRNVKLGRGGIREIEFVTQSQQLLHAGRLPFLQGTQTLPTLDKLAQYHLLTPENVRRLQEAYVFLRDVEHRLQMEENLQTHTIPNSQPARERLGKLMGFPGAVEFEAARRAHAGHVRAIFDTLMKSERTAEATDAVPREFAGAESEWKRLLGEHSFREPDRALAMLREFVEGLGFGHVSTRTSDLARRLLPKFLALCPKAEATASKVQGPKSKAQSPKSAKRKALPAVASQSEFKIQNSKILSDPDRVITRLDNFISAYGARAVLFDLWSSNPAIFELLIQLFDRSEFLAELAIRTPDMVDELVISGRLRQRKTSAETLRDLRYGLDDPDQRLWLRRYHQVELMRIGLRDILGLADPEQYLAELTALADACLQYAVEVVVRKYRLKKPPFAIIGLGKLGGAEIDYGSDLDIVFVTDAAAKDLPRLQPMAVEVMDLLSTRTELGLVFHVDARLRPDGEKGLLVNTLEAYENYYRKRAQLWEIQALTRVRPIAGDLKSGGKFQTLAAMLTDFSKSAKPARAATNHKSKTPPPPGSDAAGKNKKSLPAAWSADWRQQINAMRLRIEKERTPPGQDELAIKTGKGGLIDAEFVAQALCLENGWREPNTLRAMERGREENVLPDGDRLIASYRHLRRVEGILRRWSYEGETVLPDESEPYYRVSVRCGFESSERFRAALAQWRGEIRAVYAKVFKARP
jgi:glutamate-ammonia-ligase adenylyltransferase